MTRAQDNPAGRLGDLFDNAAADTLLADRGLRTPFLRVAKDGRTYAAGDFTAPGGVGAEIGDQLDETKLLDLFADGATLVLQGLHRTWAPIRAFAADLAADIGHPVQVNAYVTPPQNTGFSDHYDVHDVFVVQVAGSKTWRIRPPVLRHPLRSQPWENRRAAVQEAATRPPLLETTLEPGDVLYLPRGFIHAATARGAVSTHLTIGIHTWTGHHVGERLMSYAARRLAADPSVRASLPLGIDLSGPDVASNPAVAQAVEIARRGVDRGPPGGPRGRRAPRSRRPEPLGDAAGRGRADRVRRSGECGDRGRCPGPAAASGGDVEPGRGGSRPGLPGRPARGQRRRRSRRAGAAVERAGPRG